MDKFWETYNLSGKNHDEIWNMNRLALSKEIELVIQNLPARKVQDQMVSHVNSTQHLKKH